jgi:hypothetical protein
MREFIRTLRYLTLLSIILLPLAGLPAEEPNQISVNVVLPTGNIVNFGDILEGQAADLVGLTFPFQYLNGGKILFPDGSLNENISLTIEVPDFAELTANVLHFGEKIASAVRFTISVDGKDISPYYFENPIELTLSIPENLPISIGEQVSTFVLAYRDTEGNFDTTGVRTRVRDEVNRILGAEVDHFSDIVMIPAGIIGTPTSIDGDRQVPGKFSLYQNYPNPFNPETTIRYDIPELSDVTITIYNVLGQAITTLVNETKEPGQYSVVFNSGTLPSGVYIAVLETSLSRQHISMTLIK